MGKREGVVAYRQREHFEADPALIATKVEDQWFDRKSYRIEPVALANVLVGFANADGGTLVIGVENDGTISGVDAHPEQVNRLRQAAMNFTAPPVCHTVDLLPCTNKTGQPDHVIVFEVHPSDQLHRTHRNEVYKRIGDETRRLSDDDVHELAIDKGDRPFDGMPAPDMSLDDLDRSALRAFASRIGVGDDIERALQVRGLTTVRHSEQMLTWSALLLFGCAPQAMLPGAHIRILRYDGLQALPGTRSNLVFDRRVDGPLPDQIAVAQEIMSHQIRQVTRLDERSGRFVTIPEWPEFAWLEAIVNAVTHRSYSRQGDYIRVILFDDRLEVESPGRLPGPVRIDNIRRTRYSRNPRISRTLADLGIVQELNEGMKRLFDEMTRAGLPDPLLRQTDSGFVVTLFNRSRLGPGEIDRMLDLLPVAAHAVLDRLVERGRVTTGEAAKLSGLSVPTVRRYFSALEHAGLLKRVALSTTDPQSFWQSGLSFDTLWRSRRSALDAAGTEGVGEQSRQRAMDLVPERFAPVVRELFLVGRMTTGDAAGLSGLSLPTVRRYFGILEREGIIERLATSSRDPQASWTVRRSS